MASRYPLKLVDHPNAPEPAHRWLLAHVKGVMPFHIGVMHIPNMHTGLKAPYHEAVLSLVNSWEGGPALLIGDTNSGLPEIDEESPAFTAQEVRFMNGMEDSDWHDTFRYLHGDQRAYTWYSPNGKNGFRLDQAFVNRHMIDRVTGTQYVWVQSEGLRQVSDHAAILLELDVPLATPSSDSSDH
jgi:exonuclease III